MNTDKKIIVGNWDRSRKKTFGSIITTGVDHATASKKRLYVDALKSGHERRYYVNAAEFEFFVTLIATQALLIENEDSFIENVKVSPYDISQLQRRLAAIRATRS